MPETKPQQRRRPVSSSDTRESPAPEKVTEAARTREPEAEAEVEDERVLAALKVKPIRGGEVHFFAGGHLRETR